MIVVSVTDVKGKICLSEASYFAGGELYKYQIRSDRTAVSLVLCFAVKESTSGKESLII
ncbi:MAG: hypothetical protein IJ272_07580 [Clostridia bacterium]|nr:hypothetical protein [Clostridia bacterium]